MRGNLAVRIKDATNDRVVTSKVRDLKFRKTAPGGHHSASMTLLLPRGTFPTLGPNDKAIIYDTRTGATVWEGYTENPGVTDGTTGQSFDLSALGGMALASDHAQPLCYVDTSLERWYRDNKESSAASATSEASTRPTDGKDCLLMQFGPGMLLAGLDRVAMAYDMLWSGMAFGALNYTLLSGLTDTGYQIQVRVGSGPSYTSTYNQDATTTPVSPAVLAALLFTTHYPTRVQVKWLRSGGATNVATDTVWTSLADVTVRGQLADRYGNDVLMRVEPYVLPHEVVEDMLGRVLPFCDPDISAVVARTSYQITSLVYPEAVKPADLLNHLALFEPDYFWEILQSTDKGHVFNYRAWPTTARYEISTKDGYEAPGGDADLCNRIVVSWTDAKGQPMATLVTQDVPELGSRIRDAEPVTLPDGLGSMENAYRVGQQILATKTTTSRSATAVVKRPLRDLQTGRLVMPWEISAGYVVRVRETGDELRLTEMEYADNDCAATLTLGAPVLTEDQIIAALSRKVKR